jgi:hypothetical protein
VRSSLILFGRSSVTPQPAPPESCVQYYTPASRLRFKGGLGPVLSEPGFYGFSNESSATCCTALVLEHICGSQVGQLPVTTPNEIAAAGEYVYIEVRDTGCGIEAEILHKIFDPFFTTQAERGLGLAVCARNSSRPSGQHSGGQQA